mmetsp:Transcript_25936/g.29131  ORF Transcript_25936/g.29131 Transcript_25936/m.29131 type:complete len:114 (-) Transcript_25936:95-436(-)|eukprot:CAMPEP_0170865736 /NCGR_PEP_ID=MMETSP0734-20130129/21518_1 /TAXON_ID=186038 /ORGANISM="Fragilariopsis kerguelensis, Strain L26-C5" /LENGTH=113 /DNA_ID=CAMNT_0011242127 /DNA_START=57 /DNA_END=398 /DNA_ORIENTATION=+
MASFTNYDTITIKDGPLEDTNNQHKKDSTTFLRSILHNKFWATLIVVVVGSVVFLTYSATHQEIATTATTTTTSLFRSDVADGGFTVSGMGGVSRGRSRARDSPKTSKRFGSF